MKTPSIRFVSLFISFLFPLLSTLGQPPSLINFRGQLLNSGGQLVTSTVTVELRIFPTQTGGSQLYFENIGNVEVRNGQYAFQFGSNGSPDFKSVIQSNAETWVEITLAGDVLPRQRFVSVPYALSAGNAVVAPGSVTTSMLNETILKYLKPEITQQPLLNGQVNNGQSLSLSAQAEGKYLTYQWKRNGNNLNGATNATLTISDTNASQHDGNYTLVVTNDFGSVETASIPVNVLAQPSTHTADLNGTVNLEMLWVEPGTFTMGSPTTEAGRNTNETEHNVTLTKGFYLGKYEVTQAQYEAVMTGNTDGLSATPSQYGGNPNLPVEQVSWDDVQVFLTLLNAQQSANIPAGWAYVLPTESQWEYACGAGTSTMYSWGDDINATQANYLSSGLSQTNDVGNYAANPWGFFDMHGNIWEWTADWYDATYPSGNPVIDPLGADSGSLRVARGGSWGSDGAYLRSAMRSHGPPSARSDSLGFRLAFQMQSADVASPEMSIIGDANITHAKDTAWVDPGFEAHDVRDGNITGNVTVSGLVDVNSTGTYTLTYTVSDAAGNQASITRTVNVVEAQPSTHTADLNGTVNLEMIWVEPGTFTMGSPTTEAGRITNETEHNVTLTKGFYLGKYEVTQAQYEAVMTGNTNGLSATPSEWPNNPNRPVEKVSWDDIQIFLTRLNEQQSANIPVGWAYALPTESQWEYACRAGTSTMYSWGDDINATHANYNVSGLGQTRDVGYYAANPWGFFDMHGNVWEWTVDRYGTYPTGNPVIDPTGPASGSNRVFRGGSWSHAGTYLRSARRYASNPSSRNTNFGFRVGFKQQ